MPPHVYNCILSQTLTTVQKHFTHVSSPISAPGKLDYGDIDILCFGPLTPAYNPAVTPKAKVTETVARELGAKEWILGKSGQGMNLAIPWPEDEKDLLEFEKDGTGKADGGKKGDEVEGECEKKARFIQLQIVRLPLSTATKFADLWSCDLQRFWLEVCVMLIVFVD